METARSPFPHDGGERNVHPLSQKHTDQLAQNRYKARRTGTMLEGRGPRLGVTMEKLLDVEQR